MGLNSEIQHMMESFNLPQEVVDVISNSIIEAQKGSVQGLSTGQIAPNFSLINAKGQFVQLYDVIQEGPVVLSFFRGSWCPYCSLEIQHLQQINEQVQKLGGKIISIHPQRAAVSGEMAQENALDFEILSDPDQVVMEAYNVRFALMPEVSQVYKETFGFDLEKLNANGEWNLPVPATFIIDTQQVIRFRQFDHDYSKRMEPSDILSSIKELQADTVSLN